MNEIIDNIYKRRAVRKYKDIGISREVIDELIMAGKMAPSAMNKQPWKFYVLTDKEIIKKLSHGIQEVALKKMKGKGVKEIAKAALSLFHFSSIKNLLNIEDHVFYNAPVVIFISHQRDDEWGKLDVGMCAQNIMLAAKSLGLESCPVGFAKYVSESPEYALLKVPENEEVDLAIVLGYGDESPDIPNRTGDHIIYI